MKKIKLIIILISGLMIYTITVGNIVQYSVLNSNIESNPRWISKRTINFITEISGSFMNIRDLLGKYRSYIQNAEIQDGFVFYGREKSLDRLLMLTSYELGRHENEIVLYDVNKNRTLKKWNPPMRSISDLTYDEQNRTKFKKGEPAYLQHPLLLKDSSIIANTNYSLVRINSNSEIDWVENDYEAHHSVELGPDGYIWIPGRRSETKLKGLIKDENENIKLAFADDLIMKIDPINGEVVYERSVIEILIENDLDHLIYQNGHFELDPIHLNDVEPAMHDGGFWKKGDLLLSCRNLSAIILFRPSKNKIIWYKQGPWLNQHDIDFFENDKIVVFGNQVYRSDLGISNYFEDPNDHNSVFVYDLKRDTIYEPFKILIEKNNIKTRTEGRCDILPNGDIFIEDTNSGRIVIGDSINIKLEFVKRIDEEYIANLFWSRMIIN